MDGDKLSRDPTIPHHIRIIVRQHPMLWRASHHSLSSLLSHQNVGGMSHRPIITDSTTTLVKAMQFDTRVARLWNILVESKL